MESSTRVLEAPRKRERATVRPVAPPPKRGEPRESAARPDGASLRAPGMLERFRSDGAASAALLLLCLIALGSAGAPLLSPSSPDAIAAGEKLERPSVAAPLRDRRPWPRSLRPGPPRRARVDRRGCHGGRDHAPHRRHGRSGRGFLRGRRRFAGDASCRRDALHPRFSHHPSLDEHPLAGLRSSLFSSSASSSGWKWPASCAPA